PEYSEIYKRYFKSFFNTPHGKLAWTLYKLLELPTDELSSLKNFITNNNYNLLNQSIRLISNTFETPKNPAIPLPYKTQEKPSKEFPKTAIEKLVTNEVKDVTFQVNTVEG